MTTMVRGARSGLVATAAMTVPMLGERRRGGVDRIGPEHITASALDLAGVGRSPRAECVATACAHAAYGAGAGVLFELTGGRRPSVVHGVFYGLGLAVAGYQGWIPAAGILPPLVSAPRGRQREVVVSHLVYGAVLGVLAGWLRSPVSVEP